MAKKNINKRARKIMRNERIMTLSLIVSLIVSLAGISLLIYVFCFR